MHFIVLDNDYHTYQPLILDMKSLKLIFTFLLSSSPITFFAQGGLQLQYKICTECPNGDSGNGPFHYEAVANYETQHIESDYDMRVTNGTRYHQGIDYLPRATCRGDGIVAVETGAVSLIFATDGLKSIAITSDNGDRAFLYMHIFRNIAPDGLKSGNFVMKRIGTTGNYAIIDLEFDNGPNQARGRALAVAPNQIVSYNNTNYVTTNRVTAGELIAPIGNSGPAGIDPHLHIALIESPGAGISGGGRDDDRSIDPWTELLHADNHFVQRIRSRINEDFSLNTCEHTGPGNDDWGQIIPSYTNGTKNCVEVELEMQGAANPPGDLSRYNNVVMDEEEVELEIRNTNGGTFNRAVGSNFECRFVINPVGNKTIYPSEIIDAYGSPTVNGISPFTYRDYLPVSHPHDYYFFSDFYLRLHKNDILHDGEAKLANLPWDAKYSDGNYEMRTRVLDVDGNVDVGNSIQFSIDNFKPFIRQVGVNFDQIGVTAYWNQWTPTKKAGELQLGNRVEGGIPSQDPNIPPAPGPLTIYVIASESMSWLKAEIPDLATGLKTGTLIDPTIHKWKIDFGTVSGLAWDACYKIEFTGKDLSNNNLMDFQIGTPISCNEGITKKVLVDVNTGAASWAEGPNVVKKDEVHRFLIQRCTTCHQLKGEMPPAPENNLSCEELVESISLDINYASSSQEADGSINLSIDNSFEGCITWYDIDHNEIFEGPQITHLLPGWYCYEIKQECCFISNCVEVGTCQITAAAIPHHPSAPGISDGSVTLSSTGGNEPSSYIWNNGSTSAEISNLGIGTYTVTVTDGFHCSTVTSTSLINCSPIVVDLSEIIFLPSACDATDGGIKILGFSTQTSGGVSPYTYHWEDENKNIIALGNDSQYNLAPGTYCNVATDALGCRGSECFDLIPERYPTLEEIISPACSSQANGVINVAAHSTLYGFYTFTWDDGVEDSGDVYSLRENLSSGTYCVTITSEENFCSVTKCYDVPSVTPNGPLSEIHSIINPCPATNNGQIQLTVSGGVGPYSFDWTDLIEDTRNRTGLGAGTYFVKITDYCGSVLYREFTLTPISIFKTLANPGCAGLGQAEVIVYQGTGNTPYNFKWDNGASGNTTVNLISGEHCVTVTDAIGCTTSKCFPITNKEYSISVTTPCVGMSDGVISVNISNPNEGNVLVQMDGLQVFSNPVAPAAFAVNIPSLTGETTYAIDVTIEDCVYTASTTVGTQPVVHEFKSYENGECVYNDACNGVLIPNSITKMTPTIDTWEGEGSAFNKCEIPVYCPFVTEPISTISVSKEWVKAAEYEQILLQAFNYYFPQSLLDSRIAYFYSLGLADCDNVRYCPASLRITLIHHTFSPWEEATDLGEGCFALDCSVWGGNNNFCISDPGFLPELFNQIGTGGSITEECKPASVNLYQLILWEEELKTTFPNFTTTELYLQFVNYYRNNPIAKCIRVVFCQSDFSVLWSNEASVSCDDYDYLDDEIGASLEDYGFPDCGVYSTVNSGTCSQFLCLSPNSLEVFNVFQGVENFEGQEFEVYGNLETICPDYPGHFFNSPGNSGLIKNPKSCTNGQLADFGKSILEGRYIPKGITKCGNVTNFMDYSINSRIDALEEIPGLEFIIDDWDSSRIVLIRNVINEKSYSIDCHSDIEWSLLLTSNIRLKVSYFEKEDNEYVIGGEFLGNLTFGSTQISTQYSNTGFVIRVSPQGTLLDYNIVRNLDPQKPLVFVRGSDGVHIVGQSTNQPLTVDGTVYPIQSGYLTDVLAGANASSTISGSVVAFDTSLTIVRAQRSLDNSRVTYLLRGAGQVHYNGQILTGNSAQELTLVTCDNLGNVLWSEKINGQNIIGQDFDISYGASNNLLVGLTYTNALSIQGQSRASNGSSDVLLVRFNGIGQVSGMLSYGTSDGENISKMFFADSILYFGGEFNGDTTARKIGTHTFLTLSSTSSTPYISFISESSFTQDGGKGLLKSRGKAQTPISESISIYPNPFTNDLTLIVETGLSDQLTFKIFDGLGHLISESKHQTALGSNEYSLSTSQFPTGVYLIQVLSESGKTWSQKVVKN